MDHPKPRYGIISYVWGGRKKGAYVTLDGHVLEFPASDGRALRYV